MDSTDTSKWDVVEKMLLNHLTALRSNRYYHGARVVLYMEANMSWIDVDRIAGIINTRNFHIEIAKTKGRYGVTTGHHEKKMYALQVGHCLRLNTLTATRKVFGEDPARDMKLLYQQMDRFRTEVKEAKMPGVAPKITYTGKGSGSLSDDILLALMICLWHAEAQRRTTLHGPRLHVK